MPTPAEIRAELRDANYAVIGTGAHPDNYYRRDACADLAWLLAEHDRLRAALIEAEDVLSSAGYSTYEIRAALAPSSAGTS